MKLKWFHVREFQSVSDSGRIEVGEITCLVGKNEAGKSAMLRALYRLNPVIKADGQFDVTLDYPRMEVEDYRIAVDAKKRSPAVPIEACFAIEPNEVEGICDLFGPDALTEQEITLSKFYDKHRTLVANRAGSGNLNRAISG